MLMRLLIAVVVLLWVERSAVGFVPGGEPGAYSLSCRVLDSVCVVRGRIVRVGEVPNPEMPGYTWDVVTVEVRETLRGAMAATVVIYVDLNFDPKPAWESWPGEQLFFLSERRLAIHALQEAYFYRTDLYEYDRSCPIGLGERAQDPIEGRVITDDVRVLRTTGEVLDVARRAARIWGRGTSEVIELSEEGVRRIGMDPRWLRISLTPETFAAARGWATASDPWQRWAAARVLLQEWSPENIAALRRVVAYPREAEFFEVYQPGGFSRALAISTLEGWGEGELPPIVTPSPWLNVKSGVGWLSVFGIVVLPAFFVWRQGWRQVRWRRVVWWMGVSFVLVMWARSYGPMDGAVCGACDGAVVNGEVYLTYHRRSDISLPGGFTFCRPHDLLGLVAIPDSTLKAPVNWFLDIPGAWEFRGMLRPAWDWHVKLFFPVWVLLVLMLVPGGVLRIWRGFRRSRVRARRGFPVVEGVGRR